MYILSVVQAYRTMIAVMMRIIIPVASPPMNAPVSVAAFDVSGSITSCNSGVGLGLGDVDVGLDCGSGMQ